MKARLLFVQSTKGKKITFFLSFILDLNVFCLFPPEPDPAFLICASETSNQKNWIKTIWQELIH